MDVYRTVGLTPPNLRRADVIAATGVDGDRTVRWWRAMGFPEVPDDVVAFNDVDVDLVARLGELEDAGLLEDGDVLRLARLLGASFQRIAEAQLALMEELLAKVPGADPELLLRDRLGALLDQDDPTLMKLLHRSMTYVWQRHMIAALGRRLDPERAVDTEPSDDGATHEMAVGFADLAGFTKLSRSLTAAELTLLIDTFESTAFEVVAESEGRVVKLIGDEVMFVAPTLVGALHIALELGERLATMPGLPPVQCGVTFGPTVSVAGDVFGTTVNLASRLTSIARKGTVVIPRELLPLAELDPGLSVRPSRRNYSLKGLGDTKIAVVTLAESTGAEEGEAELSRR
ncbi:MAG: adenylate/guanylate cyclase domain-containing protein [Acidimicrobiales bacterium]